jgi:hypothetical protein
MMVIFCALYSRDLWCIDTTNSGYLFMYIDYFNKGNYRWEAIRLIVQSIHLN